MEQGKTRNGAVLFMLAIMLIAGFSASHLASAQDDADVQALKDKIAGHQDSLEQLNKEISGIQTQLTQIGSQKKTLQNEIKSIDLVRQSLTKEAQISQIKAQRAAAQVDQLAHSIKDKQALIDDHKKAIAFAMQRISEYDNKSLIETLLSGESLSTAFAEADQLEQIQEGLKSEIARLDGDTQALKQDKSTQEQKVVEVNQYTAQLNAQKDIVDQKRDERQQLIKETNNKESAFQAQLKEKTRRRDEFQQELDTFQSQLKIAVDASSFPSAGTKVLISPVAGAPITQHFGYTAAAKHLYANGHHSGTDFGMHIGTPVHPMASGVVMAVGDTDVACKGASYGKYVYIKHKNGLATLYGHLSKIAVIEGQAVTTSDVIAYSGNTGYSTGPHLHVGLFVSSATQVSNVPSQACPGAIFHMPAAPKDAYLDVENYM